jgi:hypothetical protein
VPRGAQPVAHRLAVRARRPATEMLDVKSQHSFSVEPVHCNRRGNRAPAMG